MRSLHPPAGPLTFRVRTTRAQSGVIAGVVLGGAAGVFGELPAQQLGISCAVAMALGFVMGKLRVSYDCSDPDCRAPLGAKSTVCPKCRRAIAGDIDDASERLVAEERVRAKRQSRSQ